MKKEKSLIVFLLLVTLVVLYAGNLNWVNKVQKATAINKSIKKNIPTDDKDNLINLPRNIYNTVDMTTSIYPQNLVGEKLGASYYLKPNTDQYSSTSKDAFVFKSSQEGVTELKWELYDHNELVAIENINILTSKIRTTPIKGLVIGDSTIITNGSGYVTERIVENLGENVELVGSMGKGKNKFEGRGGWSAATYRTDGIYLGNKNPFYNPNIKDFDFAYYMKNQEYNDLDFVIINLGINDVFNYKSNIALENDLDKIITNFDHLITSIREYDSNIKIGLNLSIPPSNDQEMFTKEFGNNLSQSRVKENNFLWVQKLLDYYGGSEEVDLVPVFMVVDTVNNFESSAHPNQDGYNQIGDQITSYLNSIN